LKERRRIVPYLKAEVGGENIFGFRVLEGNENFLHARSSLPIVIQASFCHLHHILQLLL
jgi:hypothetical protein